MTGDQDIYLMEEAGFHMSTERTNLPLDEIQGAAGIKNWDPLELWARGFKKKSRKKEPEGQEEESGKGHPRIEWVIDNLRLLTDGDYFMSRVQPKKVEFRDSYFKQRWHMKDDGNPKSLRQHEVTGELGLLAKGVIREQEENEEVLSRVVLFKTPKEMQMVSRLICCGQEANGAAMPSEHFEMPQNEDVILRMRRLGKAYYVVCDEKNAFFQQKIPREFGRTMAINYENRTYFMNVLGQGHAWSAKISHQLCWARLVLMRMSAEESMLGVRQEDVQDKCPVILTLYDDIGNEVGFITVYIDNVIVATTDKGLAHRWKQRIERNARALEKVLLKGGEALIFVEGSVEYLGVEYMWDEEELIIKWRWSEKKKMDWIKKNSGPINRLQWTPRLMGSWVGTSMWTTRIALEPLFKIRKEMSIASAAQVLARRHENDGKWDKVLDAGTMEIHWPLLEQIRKNIVTQGTHKRRYVEPQEPRVWGAVDASTKMGRGIFFYKVTAYEVDIGWRYWIRPTEEEKKKCAFVMEVKVILEALERTLQKGHNHGATMRFVSDCVGAIVCILKGYSRNAEACDMIETIYGMLENTGSTLELRWVKGIVQVADDTSRGKGYDSTKARESWEALQRDLRLPRPKGRFWKGEDDQFEGGYDEEKKLISF